MFCKQCGSQLRDGAVFCTNCGAQQNPAQEAPIQEAEPDLEKTVGAFTEIPNFQQTPPVQEPVVETPVAPVQEPSYREPAQPRPAVQPTSQAPAQTKDAYNPSAETPHNGKVSFGKAVSLFFKNYVNFSGRASKSEYWWVFLFNMITFIPLSLISSAVPPLGGLCSIALMIPGIALAVRRLHDTGKSGTYWFMGLIPLAGGIILLIEFLKDSEGDNQYGPGPNSTNGQFVNAPVNNGNGEQSVITDNDIYAMAQSHEPVNVNTPDAKRMMDGALSRIVPTYTGIENLAGAMMLCDPQSIKASIAATDTDTLIVIFKALGFYIGQGADANILGMVQKNVLATLKNRF